MLSKLFSYIAYIGRFTKYFFPVLKCKNKKNMGKIKKNCTIKKNTLFSLFKTARNIFRNTLLNNEIEI